MLKSGTCKVCGSTFDYDHLRGYARNRCDRHKKKRPSRAGIKKHPGAGLVRPTPKPEPMAEVVPPLPLEQPQRNDPSSRYERAAEKRKASGRLRGVDPTTSEIEYTDADREFIVAVDKYKRESRRPFPTLKELLGVARSLGYRKVS